MMDPLTGKKMDCKRAKAEHEATLRLFDTGVDLDPEEVFVLDAVRGIPASEPTTLTESRELLNPDDDLLAKRLPDGRIMVLIRLHPNKYPETLFGVPANSTANVL